MSTLTLSITGSKARLSRIGRQLGVSLTENARTGEPVLVVPVTGECPFASAGSLPDGRITALRRESQAWVFLSVAEFIAAIRGWTPDRAEQALIAGSQARCERARLAIERDRRIDLAGPR